ncbi:glycosyltransferase [Pseudoduganella ginsengisoli]|uniref:Glycosyl transferase family 28 C-terminal domain-containing protein n=1 Tax=Pseudoduganella ginsengisoli TaxID=1462440 RepID=A0A6L6Q6Q1_9BURK|nr:glycosyltransferase [Pseudoduganella ginsengisoli]MTW05275.1 hypothetical protein [Pseudoduganella ginsengisoli]
MARVHLCWELGGGLGHAGRLKLLAQELLAAGHEVSMSLRDLAHTHAMLGELPVPKLQAPVWLHRTVGLPENRGSLAEVVLDYGYLEPNGLAGQVMGWRAVFELVKADVVIGDYAPTAMLAARSMGLRSVSVGIGFTLPPPGRALPLLRDWENIAPQRLAQAEARVLDVANAVLARHGGVPLAWAAELFLGDATWMTAWPEMDHYGRGVEALDWLGPVFAQGGGIAPKWPAGSGPKVFAYVKTEHGQHAKVLQALAQAGCRVLCYLPEVANGMAPPVQSPAILYARKPVDVTAALSQADWCVCHGGEATVAQALLAGVPLLLLPMQVEQYLLSRRIATAGMAVNIPAPPPDWHAALRTVLSNATLARQARAFAARHAAFSPSAGVRRAIVHI